MCVCSYVCVPYRRRTVHSRRGLESEWEGESLHTQVGYTVHNHSIKKAAGTFYKTSLLYTVNYTYADLITREK